jgi:phosphoheptose isomerase
LTKGKIVRDDAKEIAERRLREGAELRSQLLASASQDIVRAAEAISESLSAGGKVLVFGNGGSAADAQHIAAEFVGRFERERSALPAVALTTDTSALTSIGNDYGFEEVFARQLRALGRAGDVAIGISTSGRSSNVLNAVRAAAELGVKTIALTGGSGGQLADACDIAVVVPASNTARIQELRIAIGHIICELVENEPTIGEVSPMTKVLDWDALLERRKRWKAAGKTVVWSNGCFDVLHVGHVESLEKAKEFGDVLIVGVNSDESARRLKGPGRPLFPATDRARLLAALAIVDAVVIFEEDTPENALRRLQPDVHVKGADYAPPNGKPVPEATVVEAYGGRVEFVPLVPNRSTTDVVERIRREPE